MENWQISTILQPTNPLILLLLACVLGVAIWTYVTIDPSTNPFRRVTLVMLRFITMLFGVYMVMQPSLIVTRTEPQPAPVAVIIDASGSMGFPDDEPRIAEAVRRTQSAFREAGLSASISPHYFSVAETVQSHSAPTDISLREDESNGTYLSSALRHIDKLQQETPFAAVLLVSDGADTTNELETAAKELHLPVNTALVDKDSRRKDILIQDIRVDEFAFARKRNPIDVDIESYGLSLTNLDVNLYKSGKLLQQKAVDLIDGRGRITFNVVPRHPGTHIYTVNIPEYPDEQYTANNTKHVAMNVVRDKYRVLHLSGTPSWDQRFLRDVMKEWPQIDLVSFYLLRTAYQSTTQSTSGLSLIPFPTEQLFTQHLREFDIVIFQNFDPATVGVDQYLNEIADYIQDGGALIVMGGTTGLTAPAIANSQLAKLLPVTCLKANLPTSKLISDVPFSPVLTEEGRRHPLFHEESSANAPEELIRSLPRISGMVKVKRLNPGGHALVNHNSLQVDDGAAPLISVADAQNGRVLVIATDSLWNWGFPAMLTGAPSTFYEQFWKQSVRWLTHSPELERLSLDIRQAKSNAPDTAVQFRTTILTPEYLPAAGETLRIHISWTDDSEQTQSVTFTGTSNNIGEYLQKWTPIHPGPHQITVSSKSQQLRIQKSFLVNDRNAEMNHLAANGRLLKKISDDTGGRFFDKAFRVKQLKIIAGPRQKILSRKDTALWSHPFTLIGLLSLLLLDWWLRKRRGIL